MNKKSVISLISYDAEYLPRSIESYYDYVDEIVLGLDENRITWNNNSFTFNEGKLFSELKRIDKENKISVIEGNFHKSKIAIENDNFERNYLKENCSHDIIISIDADEILLNAKRFFQDYLPIARQYLKSHDICMTWATPYKEIDDKTLVITTHEGKPLLKEVQGFVTHKSAMFTYARWTNRSAAGQFRLTSPLIALHYSLCRTDAALHMKINNIGHADLVEKDPFYKIWKDVNLDNYTQLHNFKTSGLGGPGWDRLQLVETKYLKDFYLNFSGEAY